ncbi:transforming acidic coiled-coil-containing protein 2-like [Vanessa cardui]|uniref:transforming acidic coiled-coil-containing protein 2-like n=1 Tax=Vanessa cardui TaxID=171605 RepID=UPI001F12E8DD|nr:transforming acidic coiled-coil-containing protein 2-like [Vanessa cardui]
MFTNILSNNSSYFKNEKGGLSNLYPKYNILSNREIKKSEIKTENMLSSRVSTIASDESFITPVSSVDDLMALSPKKSREISDQTNVTSDFLTGTDFDSICDITMQEVPTCDDMFMDAHSLDYLVKCAETNRNQTLIDRGKESLFVKFDPLYAKKMLQDASDNAQNSQTDSSECDVGYETSSSTSVLNENVTETSKHTLSTSAMISKNGKDKPTQVVPPVVSCDVPKPSTTQTKPVPALVRSVSAILTPSQVATDRLINFAGNTPPTAAPRSPRRPQYGAQEVDRLQSLRIILQNQDQEVLLLRQENRELKSSLQDIEHKFSRTKEELENKIKKLTDEKDALQEKECRLIQQVNDKTINNKQMCIVMEEYEKTISSIIGDQQKEKILSQEKFEKLTLERDQALNHLSSMESSFNDLLTKYEKCKTLILDSKERERVLNLKIVEYEAGLEKYEILYNNLKQVTADNLDKANETLDNIKKAHNVEITKLNATIKKHEIMISSLQESLIQKTRDNEELTRICDQLINEVR